MKWNDSNTIYETKNYGRILLFVLSLVRHVCFVDFGMVSGLLCAEMKSINLPLCADRRMGEIPAEIESSSDSSQLTKIRLSRTRAPVPAVRVCVMWMCESTTKFRSLLAFLWPVIYSASNIFLHAPAYILTVPHGSSLSLSGIRVFIRVWGLWRVPDWPPLLPGLSVTLAFLSHELPKH